MIVGVCVNVYIFPGARYTSAGVSVNVSMSMFVYVYVCNCLYLSLSVHGLCVHVLVLK